MRGRRGKECTTAPRLSPSSAAYFVPHRSRVADIGADSELRALCGPRSPPDADAATVTSQSPPVPAASGGSRMPGTPEGTFLPGAFDAGRLWRAVDPWGRPPAPRDASTRAHSRFGAVGTGAVSPQGTPSVSPRPTPISTSTFSPSRSSASSSAVRRPGTGALTPGGGRRPCVETLRG